VIRRFCPRESWAAEYSRPFQTSRYEEVLISTYFNRLLTHWALQHFFFQYIIEDMSPEEGIMSRLPVLDEEVEAWMHKKRLTNQRRS